jgi:hypothetical protein
MDVLGAVGQSSPNRLLYTGTGASGLPVQGDEQLLADPGFEYGTTFWTHDVCSPSNPAGCIEVIDEGEGGGGNPDFAMSSYSRSGREHATFGGKKNDFRIMSEAVTIPKTARKAELSFYLWVVAKGKKHSIDDILSVELRDANGILLTTLGKFSNRDESPTYLLRRFDVTRFRGWTVRVSFSVLERKGPYTWFLLDDATLNVRR